MAWAELTQDGSEGANQEEDDALELILWSLSTIIIILFFFFFVVAVVVLLSELHHLSKSLIFFYGSSHPPAFYAPAEQSPKCRRSHWLWCALKELWSRRRRRRGGGCRKPLKVSRMWHGKETTICQIMSSDRQQFKCSSFSKWRLHRSLNKSWKIFIVALSRWKLLQDPRVMYLIFDPHLAKLLKNGFP